MEPCSSHDYSSSRFWKRSVGLAQSSHHTVVLLMQRRDERQAEKRHKVGPLLSPWAVDRRLRSWLSMHGEAYWGRGRGCCIRILMVEMC